MKEIVICFYSTDFQMILLILDPTDEVEDLYPFVCVENADVMGSCSTFKTRKEIKNFQEVKEENSVVFVASQVEREKALFGSQYDPLITRNFSPLSYALLERIGRSR